MAELIRFLDDDYKGRWANIVMDNGDPCWVSIAQTGILVKKSKIGLFGAKLYEQKNVYKAAKTAQALSAQYPDDLTPVEMWNPVLKSIVNAVLHCDNLAEVTRVLNEADQEPRNQGEHKDGQPTESFATNLLATANRIRKANGLPESKNVNDAAVLLLTHIVAFVQGKSSHFPFEGRIENSDAVIGAVFLYFVGSQLVLHVGHAGAQLPINDVIIEAGMAVFQFLDSDRALEIIHSGMKQYKAIIKAGDARENIREYTDTISKAVWAYVMSKDEKLLEAFRSLYMTLYNAQDR